MSKKILKQGFISRYEIHDINAIKVIAAGEYEGKPYSASLEFKSSVVMQVEDEKFGLVDKEFVLVFKIPSTDDHLKMFNTWLRGLDLTKKPLYLSCTLPKMQAKDTYTLTSMDDSHAVMLQNATVKDQKTA